MIKLFTTEITQKSIDNVTQVLESGILSNGKWVEDFEEKVKSMFHFKNFLAVNSGTSALTLALRLVGIEDGDEVILPAQTFVATAMAIKLAGGIPVFADINKYGLIDIASIKEKMTLRTKAVIMVHWGGLPCNINRINAYCHEHGIKTIEDAAQAFGTKYKQSWVGNCGSDYVCFSFQGTKQFTTGDGGGLVCLNEKDANLARDLIWFGINRKNSFPDSTGERVYNLSNLGYRFHMNNIAAAIGLGQLDSVALQMVKRDSQVFYYNEMLDRKPPELGYGILPNYWFYHMMANERNSLIRKLDKNGFESSVVHQGIDRNIAFGGFHKELRNQRIFEEHFIALPLVAPFYIEQICNIVKEHESKHGKFEWL
jgi:perosamine synthetase